MGPEHSPQPVYKGSTLDSYTRSLKIYWQWCATVGIEPIEAKRGQLEMYVRWLENQPWAESTISTRFIAVACIDATINGRTSGPLMVNNRGHRITPGNARYAIDRVAINAGIKPGDMGKITPHGLRRSFISCGLAMGKELYTMQLAAGHANPNTTARYDRLRKNINKTSSTVYDISGYLSLLNG